MRIPSQFNEDSLYRRGGRSAQPAQSYRRLLRLVLGLALVVVIMRQASRPEIYQAFFGDTAFHGCDDRRRRNSHFDDPAANAVSGPPASC